MKEGGDRLLLNREEFPTIRASLAPKSTVEKAQNSDQSATRNTAKINGNANRKICNKVEHTPRVTNREQSKKTPLKDVFPKSFAAVVQRSLDMSQVQRYNEQQRNLVPTLWPSLDTIGSDETSEQRTAKPVQTATGTSQQGERCGDPATTRSHSDTSRGGTVPLSLQTVPPVPQPPPAATRTQAGGTTQEVAQALNMNMNLETPTKTQPPIPQEPEIDQERIRSLTSQKLKWDMMRDQKQAHGKSPKEEEEGIALLSQQIQNTINTQNLSDPNENLQLGVPTGKGREHNQGSQGKAHNKPRRHKSGRRRTGHIEQATAKRATKECNQDTRQRKCPFTTTSSTNTHQPSPTTGSNMCGKGSERSSIATYIANLYRRKPRPSRSTYCGRRRDGGGNGKENWCRNRICQVIFCIICITGIGCYSNSTRHDSASRVTAETCQEQDFGAKVFAAQTCWQSQSQKASSGQPRSILICRTSGDLRRQSCVLNSPTTCARCFGCDAISNCTTRKQLQQHCQQQRML